MNILVLSDIHGNVDALEAVLMDVGPVDAVVCLGDLVGYGPNPNEVVERVRGLHLLACLVGNHDLAALGHVNLALFNHDAARAASWTADRLQSAHRDWLDGLSPKGNVDETYLAHASPVDPVWEYLEEPSQGLSNFAAFAGPLCFVGHTHVPRLFEHGGSKGFTPVHPLSDRDRVQLADDIRMIVNPGSVGQPRDGDWRASYGVWDTDERWFELHRVEYPVELTQRKIADAGLPVSAAERLSVGR